MKLVYICCKTLNFILFYIDCIGVYIAFPIEILFEQHTILLSVINKAFDIRLLHNKLLQSEMKPYNIVEGSYHYLLRNTKI